MTGSFPIRLRGSATLGTTAISHLGTPVLGGRAVDNAYLTVLDAAPFTVESVAALGPQRLMALAAEEDALAARLSSPNPQVEAAQAEWEKKFTSVEWTPLADPKITSSTGGTFTVLADHSILATGTAAERDTYTLVASTDVANITAVRLETLPDDSLPAKGPGRNPAGNFVLTRFAVTLAPAKDPLKASPIPLQSPIADFEQDGFPVGGAIDPAGKGWAMFPRSGIANNATFFTNKPLDNSKGDLLTLTLDHQFGQQHLLGHFRISVASDAAVMSKAAVPKPIADLLATAAEKRPAEAKAKIAAFYRTIDPGVADASARLTALRTLVAPRAEIARLEASLTGDLPELNARRDQWEKSAAAGEVWLPLDLTALHSKSARHSKNKRMDPSWSPG